MSDNVVKFRKIEKVPEPKPPRQELVLPGWVPFAVLIGLALLIYGVQQSGLLAG